MYSEINLLTESYRKNIITLNKAIPALGNIYYILHNYTWNTSPSEMITENRCNVKACSLVQFVWPLNKASNVQRRNFAFALKHVRVFQMTLQSTVKSIITIYIHTHTHINTHSLARTHTQNRENVHIRAHTCTHTIISLIYSWSFILLSNIK